MMYFINFTLYNMFNQNIQTWEKEIKKPSAVRSQLGHTALEEEEKQVSQRCTK